MNSLIFLLVIGTVGLALFILACTLFLYLASKYDKIQFCYGCRKIIERDEELK